MSATSKLLAREIVRLDVAIQAAARAHLWFDAQDLEEQRERAVDTRWSIMRREWVDQSREAVAWTSEHDVDRCRQPEYVQARQQRLKSAYCRKYVHWACYGRAGQAGRKGRELCECGCHNKKEESTKPSSELMDYLTSADAVTAHMTHTLE